MDKSGRKSLYIYYCGYQACESGHSFGPAIRPHYLMHFILSGSGSYQAEGNTYVLKAGDAFLIQPGEMTFYQASNNEPWAYAWVAFDGIEAEELLVQCGFSSGNLGYIQGLDEHISVLSKQLAERFAASDCSQLELRGLLYLIFARMVKGQLPERSMLQQEYVKKACDYIENNFSYDIKVFDIARFVGIDRTYLYKVFIAEKGKSPQQFLMDKRMNEARNLLLHSKLTITEIAYSCGFHDAPSFCRHFKTAEKCTPLQYRKRMHFS